MELKNVVFHLEGKNLSASRNRFKFACVLTSEVKPDQLEHELTHHTTYSKWELLSVQSLKSQCDPQWKN